MPNGLINQVSFNSWNTWQVEGGVKTPHSARHSQSQPWKHMVDRQAHWATILTWRWLTHVERGRCEGEGSRGHRSAHFLSSNAPRGPPSDGQETSAAVPPPNPNPPPEREYGQLECLPPLHTAQTCQPYRTSPNLTVVTCCQWDNTQGQTSLSTINHSWLSKRTNAN